MSEGELPEFLSQEVPIIDISRIVENEEKLPWKDEDGTESRESDLQKGANLPESCELDELIDGEVVISGVKMEELTDRDGTQNEPVSNQLDEDVSDHEEELAARGIVEPTQEDFAGSTGGRRTRQVFADMSQWKRMETKQKRCQGQAYTGYRRMDKKKTNKVIHDVVKPARSLGPRCSSVFCARNSGARKCDSIDENGRQLLFDQFWTGFKSWEEKKMFICSFIDAQPPKTRRSGENNDGKNPRSPKQFSYTYNLRIGPSNLPVCRKMFESTFGLKWSTIRGWLEDYRRAFPVAGPSEGNVGNLRNNGEPGRQDAKRPLPRPKPAAVKSREDRRAHLEKFLQTYPKLPSHYSRANSNKLYLQEVTTLKEFHDRYKEDCVDHGIRAVNRTCFRKELRKQNLAIFQPRKDQCDTCTAYTQKQVSQEDYDAHQLRKLQAREEKHADKHKAINNECYTICSDLMAVKMVPQLLTSSAYYKLKIPVHNFTMYNMEDHEATCYYFDETTAGLEASVFASFVTDFLKPIISKDPKPVVLWSDGCNYQNRNSVMSNALLHLAMEKNVQITQKYLERGHTQMECDSVHATIENKLKGREVYLPSHMAILASEARTKPAPYKVKTPDFTFFRDFSQPQQNFYTSIRPGKRAGDPTVTDLRELRYDPDGSMKFKLNFSDNWQEIPVSHRSRKKVELVHEFPRLYTACPKIPKDKFNDLQDLKKFLPADCRPFYDAIPHEDESRRAKKRAAQKPSSSENSKKMKK